MEYDIKVAKTATKTWAVAAAATTTTEAAAAAARITFSVNGVLLCPSKKSATDDSFRPFDISTFLGLSKQCNL